MNMKKKKKKKNDLSNSQTLLNKKTDLMKEEISSSSGNTSDTDSIDREEKHLDMPFLETEQEAAENIANIYERKDTRKKDYRMRTFAPQDNTEEAAKNITDISKQKDTIKE